MKGSCNCGAVAFEFELNADLPGVIICHCSICRRATGSNGIAVLVVNNADFRWLGGEDQVASWKKPDGDWEMWFCRTCGSPVPGTNNARTLFVPAGLVSDGGGDLEVIHHVYVDSKATWDEIGDSGRQHRDAFEASG